MKECSLLEIGTNPFTTKYLSQEIKWYDTKDYEKDGLTIKSRQLKGRCDDFFNKNFRIADNSSPFCPILLVDNQIWMSLTYMETQSMFLPIFLAEGKIATSGLGLGYFPMRVAEKDECDSIDVYEIDQRVIDYFNQHFSNRKEFDKINIIKGDVMGTLKDKQYDFMFADHYPDMLDDVVLDDFKHFNKVNDISNYYFWGQERIILQYKMDGYDLDIQWYERELFKWWIQGEDHEMYNPVNGDEFIEDALILMKRI